MSGPGADVETIEGRRGGLEAFLEARNSGMTRFIGVTGHHDPEVLHHCMANWPVDTVLLPVNPPEAVIGGFLDRVLAEARDQGIAAIGIKILGGSNYIHLGKGKNHA
jgi:hypothetical protein